MPVRRAILLTGATGLLGRFLLKDLLRAGIPVAVLARDSGTTAAQDRVEEILSFWGETLGTRLARPQVLAGDVSRAGLGLGQAERDWLSRNAAAVVHSAACVAYQTTPDGEPWKTNVDGTRRLFELCRGVGISDFHHLSTAYLCGDRRGVVREDELDAGCGPANAYEGSKLAAEQALRAFPDIRATVYRPSVIVGDGVTGYTSTYHHFYRFLELAVRLSGSSSRQGPASRGMRSRHRLPVRLPLTGEETQNLVPVDWVSRAVVDLLRRPAQHGRTYHLVAWQSVRLQEIKAVVEDLLRLEGIEWVGPEGLADPTTLEQMVLEQFHDYWTYLRSDLQFDCRNARRALAHLPPPRFDRDSIARLLRFAQDDHWGRKASRKSPQAAHPSGSDCGQFLEDVLPRRLHNSPLGRALPRDLSFAIDIRGPGGGRWSCRVGPAGLLQLKRDDVGNDGVTYRTDAPTFHRLIQGHETAQAAFFDGRITIDGDTEKGLKLAVLIEQFLAENARPSGEPKGTPHAAAGCQHDGHRSRSFPGRALPT
jgi:nucleoside-diphosphate-sugar epimerase